MIKRDRKIWVLEDDPSSVFVYEEILGVRYFLSVFRTLREFRSRIWGTSDRPDLLIADLRLPDGNFLNLLSEMEIKSVTFPFLVVSSSNDIDLLRSCYEEGALDYLTKPFSEAELIVKIERILPQLGEAAGVPRGEILLEPTDMKLVSDLEYQAQLTTRELQIFRCLQKARNRPMTKHQIFQDVWGNHKVGAKTLDVHLYNLRRKLADVGIEIRYKSPDSFELVTKRP